MNTNPFAHNPFEILDRVGMWTASRAMRFVYRGFRVNPIVMHHVPRALFALCGGIIFLSDPLGHLVMPLGLLLFGLICLPKLRRDLPAIRSEWDLTLYRRYQARALADRDTLAFRSFTLVIVLLMAVVSLNSFSWDNAMVCIADMIMLACLLSSMWFDVCDLPEPDDGDVFARPHTA